MPRLDFAVRKTSLRHAAVRAIYGPIGGQHWVRVELDRAVNDYLTSLRPQQCDAVEISGGAHSRRNWRSYRSANYPDFDLLDPTPIGQFDVVICEQVLEHVVDPVKAMATLVQLCRPGGHVLITTPFLLRVHPAPLDMWRYTPDGLAHLATNAGLSVDEIGSWGNAWCTFANRRNWAKYRAWHRVLKRFSLANDPQSPQVVWAFTHLAPGS